MTRKASPAYVPESNSDNKYSQTVFLQFGEEHRASSKGKWDKQYKHYQLMGYIPDENQKKV